MQRTIDEVMSDADKYRRIAEIVHRCGFSTTEKINLLSFIIGRLTMLEEEARLLLQYRAEEVHGVN